MSRNTFFSILLSFGGVLIALVVIETGLYLFGAYPGQDMQTQSIYRRSANPDRQYELVPGRTGATGGGLATVNEHGHRGPAGVDGKFAGIRILIMGDSIAFGYGVSAEQSFPNLLNEKLDAGEQRYEVLNFGVPGYDLIQTIAYVEEIVEHYQPDYVLYAMCLNDLDVYTIDYAEIENFSRVQKNFWHRNFRIARLIYSKFNQIRGRWNNAQQNQSDNLEKKFANKIKPIGENEDELRRLMKNTADDFYSRSYGSEAAIGRLRYGFQRLAELSKTYNFRIVVAVVPIFSVATTGYQSNEAHKIISLEAASRGLPFIDLLNAFNRAELNNYKRLERDVVHPSPAGHAVIADYLAAYFLNRSDTQPR